MAAPKKLLLGKGGELVNYDYFDIAEGTGIKNFYGAQAEASGAITQYFLTTDNTTFSNRVVEKVKSAGDSNWNVGSNVNYDVQFNLPKKIYGEARLSFSQGCNLVGGACNTYVNAFLYHYDGTTSTLMASGASTVTTSASGQVTQTKNIPFHLTSQKWNFKKGDILRLNLKLYEQGGNATNTMGYGCDPQDRDDTVDASGAITVGSSYTTQLKIAVPFLLDL